MSDKKIEREALKKLFEKQKKNTKSPSRKEALERIFSEGKKDPKKLLKWAALNMNKDIPIGSSYKESQKAALAKTAEMMPVGGVTKVAKAGAGFISRMSPNVKGIYNKLMGLAKGKGTMSIAEAGMVKDLVAKGELPKEFLKKLKAKQWGSVTKK